MNNKQIYNKIKNTIQDRILYQEHTWDNKIINKNSIRLNDRRSFIDHNDVVNKNIIDLGCATGSDSMWAIESGASSVFSIDNNLDNILIFNKIKNILPTNIKDKINIYQYDLNNDLNLLNINLNIIDTVFCFSITHHINYYNIWEKMPCAKTIYIEGGNDSPYTLSSLKNNKYNVEIIGYSSNNRKDNTKSRPLFKMVKW